MRTIIGLRISAAAAGAVCALAILPGGANAAFDAAHDAQCEGTSTVAGIGASFQRQAHLAWGAQMLAPDPAAAEDNGFGRATALNGGCADFRVGATAGKKVTYEPRGSGDGRNAMGASIVAGVAGVRNTDFQFAGADEPPNADQLARANDGASTAASDNAVLLTVPVAQSSVATVVKLPAGCTVPGNGRRMTRAQLAGAFAASANFTQWGQVLPGITGTDCATKPVKRFVRVDSSGTTFAFKNYLRDINPTDFPATGQSNTAWPNENGANPVVRGNANGVGALLDALNGSADGGIGYADLAAARARGFDSNVEPANVPGSNPPVANPSAGQIDASDTTFWVSVANRQNEPRSPALSDAKGTSNTGSNCRNTTYQNGTSSTLPAVTESWINVNANASTADYPLCALTYELVWQDMLKANAGIAAGKNAYTQDQARAVKDYLGYILNANGGQAALAANGYQGLPAVDDATGGAAKGSMLELAQAAQGSLTWNGSQVITPPGGGGGGDTGGGNTGGGNTGGGNTGGGNTPTTPGPGPAPVPGPAPAPAPAPKPVETPAAKVAVSKAVGVKGRRIALTVSPSAAGKLAVTATTRKGKRTLTIGRGTLTVKKGGKLLLVVTPSGAGKRALTPGRTEKVTFKVTFTAKTGKKTTVTKTVKVKIKR